MSDELVTSATTVVRDPTVTFADMDGDLVMMSPDRGRYFGVGGVGPFLWEQLASPTTVGALCERTQQRYEVDPATCEADVTAFVDELLAHGVVRRVE